MPDKRPLEGIISNATDKEIQRLGRNLVEREGLSRARLLGTEEKIFAALLSDLDVADGKSDRMLSRETVLKKIDLLKQQQWENWDLNFDALKKQVEALPEKISVDAIFRGAMPRFALAMGLSEKPDGKPVKLTAKQDASARQALKSIPGGYDNAQNHIGFLFTVLGAGIPKFGIDVPGEDPAPPSASRTAIIAKASAKSGGPAI